MGDAEEGEVLDTEQQQDTDEGDDTLQGGAEGGDEGAEGEGGEGGENPDAGEGEEDVVQIGDEEPPASEEGKAPAWVKELRQRQRELARENAELKAKLGTGQPAQQKPTLPERPKLADYDFDEERFQAAVDDWHAKKREVDAFEDRQKAAVEAAQREHQAVHDAYVASTKALKVKDFPEAEEQAAAVLDQVQQAILKKGARNPGRLVYALGTNPKRLAELASIKDPVKFTWAAAQLETEVKVTKRTSTKPAPETTVRGGKSSAGGSSATLDRLRAEADKTGDRSKVAAFLRQQRQAGK